MATVLVFCFYTYDAAGREVHSPRAATLDAIEMVNGVPMRETGLEVDESQLDFRGFLKGPASCDHPVHREPR